MFGFKLEVDEAAKDESLGKYCAKKAGRRSTEGLGVGAVVLGNQSADRYAGERIQKRQYSFEGRAAHVLKIHVDPFGARRLVRSEVGRAMINDLIKPELALHEIAFQIATGNSNRAGSGGFANCPTSDPTGPLAAATTTVSPATGLSISLSPE
jgi:hypothetical protein